MFRDSIPALALAICGLAAGCNRPIPQLVKDPSRALASVPPDVRSIGHFPGSQFAMAKYARDTLKGQRPACFDRVASQIQHVFSLGQFSPGAPVWALYGIRERVAAEECAGEVLRALLKRPITFEREGAVTRAVTEGSRPLFIAWSSDGWLYFHEDRARVEAMLARPATPTLDPSLLPLLARFSVGEQIWTVSAGDLTTGFVGVPSAAVIWTMEPGDPSPGGSMSVTFIFRSEFEARRAVDALAEAASSAEYPVVLRDALGRLRPALRGTEVELDAFPLLSDARAMEAASAVLKRRAAPR